MCLRIRRALVFSEKLINAPAGYLQRSVDQRKVCSWGRRLAWFRIHAWGVCDPGFKSQRPHHKPPGPYLYRVELKILRGYFFRTFFYFRFLKIFVSLNSQTYSNPASISYVRSAPQANTALRLVKGSLFLEKTSCN